MKLVGAGGQISRDIFYDASVVLTSALTNYLVLPEHRTRTSLKIQNTSGGGVWVEIGAGTATAAINTGGQVTTITVKNPGFNYTVPPIIEFFGGGSETNSTFVGCGSPGYGSPGTPGFGQGVSDTSTNKPAQAVATLSGSAIQSIVITDPGAGYVVAPFVLIRNSPQDPNGCAAAGYGSGSGFYLLSGASNSPILSFDATFCPTSPVSVWSTTSGAQVCCKFGL
jgi:hypothetical protein